MNEWHVQVIAPLPGLLSNADVLAKSPVTVVIDHYGLYGDKRPESPRAVACSTSCACRMSG